MKTFFRRMASLAAFLMMFGTAAFGQTWKSNDIGNTLPGSTNIAGGVITIEGDGNDIWSFADAFRFVHQQGSGDIEMVARLTSQEFTDQWAKAGVMIRQSLQAGSTHAYMCRTIFNGSAFQNRLVADGSSNNVSGAPSNLPRWLRLVREGNDFTGYQASDNNGQPGSWSQVGPTVSIVMTDPVYVGLAVTSHDATQLCTAVFDSVSITE